MYVRITPHGGESAWLVAAIGLSTNRAIRRAIPSDPIRAVQWCASCDELDTSKLRTKANVCKVGLRYLDALFNHRTSCPSVECPQQHVDNNHQSNPKRAEHDTGCSRRATMWRSLSLPHQYRCHLLYLRPSCICRCSLLARLRIRALPVIADRDSQ